MKKIIIVIAAALIMPSLLVLTAFIPKGAIKEHTLESGKYLYEGELFGYEKDGIEGSCIDRYADSILLNIAYHFDSEYPLKSVMLSAYYFTPDHEENENFYISVKDDLGITRQYLRYWHGSILLVRPLLLVMNVREIYVLNAIVLILLLGVFCFMLARQKEYPLIIAMTAALILTRSWYVPLSLEYTWTYMLMLMCSIIAIAICKKERNDFFIPFFAITGMATSFVDFLTTETITLLIPLLVILWLERGRISYIKTAISCAIPWLMGYALMWMSKWFLCSWVMKENALPYVSEHVAERLSGDMGMGTAQFVTGAVLRNISCLFPLGYGAIGVIGFLVLILYACYRGYVYRRPDHDRAFIVIAIVVALVPYLRYAVLHNHSFIHYFFTFRAQAATVMALVLITAALSENRNER